MTPGVQGTREDGLEEASAVTPHPLPEAFVAEVARRPRRPSGTQARAEGPPTTGQPPIKPTLLPRPVLLEEVSLWAPTVCLGFRPRPSQTPLRAIRSTTTVEGSDTLGCLTLRKLSLFHFGLW